MEGQHILSPQKLASPKHNNHPRPPTEGSAAAGSPMSQNRDVIHLPLNLQPPPGDIVPQAPQIQPPGKNSGGKKEGGGGERSRRMSEISAAQKLASIVEESEHGSSLSTSGTFTDSSSRPPLAGRKGSTQVWSLTQFYSVDFSQSRIGVNKCVFNKRTIKVCLSCC